MKNRNQKGVIDGVPFTQVEKTIILKPSENRRISWVADKREERGILKVYEFVGQNCRRLHMELTNTEFPKNRALALCRKYMNYQATA